jgi:hypothetical protein
VVEHLPLANHHYPDKGDIAMAINSLEQTNRNNKQMIYTVEKSLAALQIATCELRNFLYGLHIETDAKRQANSAPITIKVKE